MQYLELLSKLLSFFAQISKWFQKKYYVGESLDFHRVNFDYYPEPRDSKPMFAFKVSSIPKNDHNALRNTLTFTLVNKTNKPIKVVAVQFEDKKGKMLPLHPLSIQLPKVLEAFIGDFPVSIIIDQLWAFAVVMDKRFTHPFSSLFFFENLAVNLESVAFKLSDGTLTRHKVSKKMLAEVKKMFNPIPEIPNLPTPETQCSVDGCSNRPDYIVLLYDHYDPEPIFFEQDYTCPFLCEDHMQENERGVGNAGAGERRYPRAFNRYPYSNRFSAQGYTKYSPMDRKITLQKD